MIAGKRKSVPISPTNTQIDAAYVHLTAIGAPSGRAKRICVEIYRAMIETAPQAETGALTANMRKLLQFIQDFIDENGYSPSLAEMQAATGIDKKNLNHPLNSLERRGYITREEYGWRSTQVLKRI